jgi:hypothetical protein
MKANSASSVSAPVRQWREWRVSLPAYLCVGLLFVGLLTGGCAKGAPRGRPVEMGPVDTGAGSLEAVRRQLEGTWDLTRLEIYPATGSPRVQKAQAVLTYDAYGNMTIAGRLEQPDDTAAAAAPLLSYKGRAVIDTARQQLRLMDVEGPEAKVPDEVKPEMLRKYEFEGGTLHLSTIDASGRVNAKASWKKR